MPTSANCRRYPSTICWSRAYRASRDGWTAERIGPRSLRVAPSIARRTRSIVSSCPDSDSPSDWISEMKLSRSASVSGEIGRSGARSVARTISSTSSRRARRRATAWSRRAPIPSRCRIDMYVAGRNRSRTATITQRARAPGGRFHRPLPPVLAPGPPPLSPRAPVRVPTSDSPAVMPIGARVPAPAESCRLVVVPRADPLGPSLSMPTAYHLLRAVAQRRARVRKAHPDSGHSGG
jgi:hypothetical protein